MFRYSILSVLFIVVLLGALNTAHAGESLEYQLARFNAGGYVSEDHITVARFRSLLDQLSSTYVENKQQIADMSAKMKDVLKKDGVEESVLNIMEGMNQLFTSRINNQKYSDCISLYATLRVKGFSHSEAISGLQGIFQDLRKLK